MFSILKNFKIDKIKLWSIVSVALFEINISHKIIFYLLQSFCEVIFEGISFEFTFQ